MKRTALVFASIALAITFTQCKKTEIPTSDEGVRIILTAGYSGNRTAFTPSTGAFVWSDGATEYIYVGGSQHEACLGVLSGTGNGTGSMTFGGTLTTTPNEGETLHFFYLGKGKDGSAVSTLDFSSQDGTLENVTNYHIAVGEGSYTSGNVNYATTLEMKMAIAYFDMSGFQNASNTAETVYLHGDEFYTTATVNYQDGTITGAAKGYLNMGTATNDKYIALIPSVTTETMLKFDSDSKTGTMTFNRGIQAQKYYSNDGAALAVTASNLPEGATSGLFSVSATKMVRFAKGNLQYNKTTSEWSFMANQYDRVETENLNVGVDYADQNIVSLFGWGTSGYNHNDAVYQPWATSNKSSSYYAYGSYQYNLYDQTGQADWGYNAIANGGNQENFGWRTLTTEEWYYVFNTRSTVSGIRYAKANINVEGWYRSGVILLPDNWAASTYTLNSTNSQTADFTTNSITPTENWVNILEANGAVFLPAAGYRHGDASVDKYNNVVVNSVGANGYYWSASPYGYSNKGYVRYVYFTRNSVTPQSSYYRDEGYSVRLVRDVQ